MSHDHGQSLRIVHHETLFNENGSEYFINNVRHLN